jgi:hypothetical protein
MKSSNHVLKNMETDIRTRLENLIERVTEYRRMGGKAHPKISAALAEAQAYTYIDVPQQTIEERGKV